MFNVFRPFRRFDLFRVPHDGEQCPLALALLRDADGNVLIDADGNAFVRKVRHCVRVMA